MSSALPSRSRLQEIVRRFESKQIIVVGDLIADIFVFGEISRISREAPVMIIREEESITVPGGAANAAMNAAALGARVHLVGVLGRDPAGISLLDQVSARGINCDAVCWLERYRTPSKTRILAGLPSSQRQQVLRIDHEPSGLPEEPSLSRVLDGLGAQAKPDAVILSDYHYGLLSGVLLDKLEKQRRSSSVPWVVDSRHRLDRFAGMTAATPNQSELEELAGKRLSSSEQLQNFGDRLREEMGWEALLVTLGEEGMVLFRTDSDPVHMGVIGTREVVDVTGAGDTVTATFTMALAAGADFLEAAVLANHAAGLVVMKRGTASITAEELLVSLRE